MKVKTYTCKISIKQTHIDNGFDLTSETMEQLLIAGIKDSDKYDFDIKVSRGIKREI
jgi:hypothetical protein